MEAAVSSSPRVRWAVACCVTALACFRFCHIRLLWADEDYHLAAAIQILHGKLPYRDFWYDKPPLSAIYYLLIGGYSGWPLRILDAIYIVAACWLAFRIAREMWSEAEGWAAALLLAFFTTFYLPSAVIPFAADALMLVPHLAAVYCALKKRPVGAGFYAGLAFLANAKAVFVLAACGVWLLADLPLLCLGFAVPTAAGLVAALLTGVWHGYYEQVWRWGLLYAERSPVLQPWRNGLLRTLDWLGFHAALALGAIFAFPRLSRDHRLKLAAWLALSFLGVSLGWRFAPHYFFQVLPPLVVIASRGILVALREHKRLAAAMLAASLLGPLIRFGPRYASLAYDNLLNRNPNWIDVVMDLDSQQVARKIAPLAYPGATLLVWGYRPDIYVYTRMSSDSRFWDSQPLTGVPADRHLKAIDAIYRGPAGANREELARSSPTLLVDGLGLLNPKLAPGVYPELRSWLAQYELVDRTKLTLIYRKMYRIAPKR
jgi:4-amino-4-deoxy-L-arabinose transferase-like glycosyltransferase